MNAVNEGIRVRLPEKVFFSNDPAHYTVKNDFAITVCKASPETNRICCPSVNRKGELYPTIYIRGFAQLFEEGEFQNTQMTAFLNMFFSSAGGDWSMGCGKFRDTEEVCAVITTAALSLPPDFSVGFYLSDKCAFTKDLETPSPITLEVCIDDFDLLFSDLPDRISYQISLDRGFAACVNQFGAYRNGDDQTPVNVACKGEFLNISWITNEKTSAFLYDETGSVVANLPPYTAIIDRDRHFRLTAYNDFCSVTHALTVYRTLWRKKDCTLMGFPKTDGKGRFRFYRDYGGTYYLYVHPSLYSSRDLTHWTVCAQNISAPEDAVSYFSSFSDGKFGVCYVSNSTITYCEMDLLRKQWKCYTISRPGLLSAQALYLPNTVLLLAAEDGVALYDFANGALTNGRYLEMPDGVRVKAVDGLSDGRRGYVAVLYDNGRAYFYDLLDDFKNNIFECPDVKSDWVSLVKSNAMYLILDGQVLEVCDREKFMDLHFFPQCVQKLRPVLGAADCETITGVFQTEQGAELWQYKF